MAGRFTEMKRTLADGKREAAEAAVAGLPAALAAAEGPQTVMEAIHGAGRIAVLMHHMAGSRYRTPPPALFHAMRGAVESAHLDEDVRAEALVAIDGYDVAAADEIAFSAPGLGGLSLGADDLSLVAHVAHRAAADRYGRLQEAEAKAAGHGRMSLMDRVASRIAKSSIPALVDDAKAADPKFASPEVIAGYVVEAARRRCAVAETGPDGFSLVDATDGPSPDRLLEQAERMASGLDPDAARWVVRERERRGIPDLATLDASRFGSGWSATLG